MSGIKDTVWDLEPHTQAKHEILKSYLKAWFPILSRYNGNIIYLDGFAGPGIYSKGEFGSPVIAISTALNHSHKGSFGKIVFLFIEKDSKRMDNLKFIINKEFPSLPDNITHEFVGAPFAPTLGKILEAMEQKNSKLAPTFAFLDPFGFSGLPMNVISRLLLYEKVEVFITFMSGFITRFADNLRSKALTELFGDEDWRQVNEVDPHEKDRFLIDLYRTKLRHYTGVQHIRSFEMSGERGQVVYHLVYATNSLKGLEVMKKAMLNIDKRGIYKFSDRTNPVQTQLIDFDNRIWVPRAAEMVFDKFRGNKVDEESIRSFVLADTPYDYQKKILEYLERSEPPKILNVTDRPRKFVYPKGCLITFAE